LKYQGLYEYPEIFPALEPERIDGRLFASLAVRLAAQWMLAKMAKR
jgi:hypothetical protein